MNSVIQYTRDTYLLKARSEHGVHAENEVCETPLYQINKISHEERER